MLFAKEQNTVVEMTEPAYVAGFACDGAACASLCCKAWGAVIDDKTLARYRTADGHLGEELRAGISRDPDCGKWMIRKKKGVCVFLADDGLCSLQKRYGTVALPDVCAAYPRETVAYDGRYERTLCMTCPVAARRALLGTEPMHFTVQRVEIERDDYVDALHIAPEIRGGFFAVKSAAIEILEERSLTIRERLAALGLYYSFIPDSDALFLRLTATKTAAELAARAIGGARDVLSAMPLDERDCLRFFAELIPEMAKRTGDSSERTARYAARSRALFGDGIASEHSRAFAERRRLYDERVAPYSHIVENCLVNAFFTGAFLKKDERDSMTGFALFALYYEYLHYLVLIDERLETGDVQEILLDAIYYLALHRSHTSGYADALMGYLGDSEADEHFFETVFF